MPVLNNKEMVCDYCGTAKSPVRFTMDSSHHRQWVLWVGTGKLSCESPNCFQEAKRDSKQMLDLQNKRLMQ